MIDLHAHTTASDGTSSPGELVQRAKEAGISILAVTDHDTVAAIEVCIREAAQLGGIRIVPGIELSASWQGREIHVLGHFIDPTGQKLLSALDGFRADRRSRIEAMVERCRKHGATIRFEDLHAGEGEGTFGRPHLARALVAAGHASDMQHAFDEWLGAGRPGFVERVLPEAAEAISLIHEAGGCATVAHPSLSRLGPRDFEGLAAAGMIGIEIGHPRQPAHIRRTLRKQARALGLVATSGSDDHGPGGGVTRLGAETMDAAEFASYASRAPGYRPEVDLR